MFYLEQKIVRVRLLITGMKLFLHHLMKLKNGKKGRLLQKPFISKTSNILFMEKNIMAKYKLEIQQNSQGIWKQKNLSGNTKVEPRQGGGTACDWCNCIPLSAAICWNFIMKTLICVRSSCSTSPMLYFSKGMEQSCDHHFSHPSMCCQCPLYGIYHIAFKLIRCWM